MYNSMFLPSELSDQLTAYFHQLQLSIMINKTVQQLVVHKLNKRKCTYLPTYSRDWRSQRFPSHLSLPPNLRFWSLKERERESARASFLLGIRKKNTAYFQRKGTLKSSRTVSCVACLDFLSPLSSIQFSGYVYSREVGCQLGSS